MGKKTSFAIFFFLLSSLVSAQSQGEILSAKWSWVLCNVLCVIFFVSGAISAVVIAFAGLKYTTTESSLQRDEAKKRMIYAVIGLIVVLLSILLVNYLVSVSRDVKSFSCVCTTLFGNSTNSSMPYPSPTSSLTVEIIYPGDGSEFDEDTGVQFLGHVYQGAPTYEYSWSSSPSGISRKVAKDYSMDSFSEKLSRGEYTITLGVTDDTGKTATDSVKIKIT